MRARHPWRSALFGLCLAGLTAPASAQDADICQFQEADFAITGTRHEL
jgi:hypothetical protein